MRNGKSWKFTVFLTLVFVSTLTISAQLQPAQLARAASGIVPRMPEGSGPVDVIDTSNDSSAGQYAAQALQGIVNRTGSLIYLIGTQYKAADQFWIGATDNFNRRGANYLFLDGGLHPGLDALYRKYRSYVSEFDVYDPRKDWTFDLAMTAAGIDNGLPVDANTLHDLTVSYGSLPVQNFTDIGTDRISGYEWGRLNLMPQASKSAVFLLGLNSEKLYDYATANRAFVFKLNTAHASESVETDKLLANYAPRTPLLGYNGECADCFSSMASRNGLYGFAADYLGNASVWSSFPIQTGFVQQPGRAAPLAVHKVYVTTFSSDGDNLQFDQNDVFNWFNDPNASVVPHGYSIDPLLIEIAPPLLQWMYNHLPATGELMGGPSGLGYPDASMSAQTYADWLSDDATYMAAAGLREATLWNLGGTASPRVRQYFNTHPNISGAFVAGSAQANQGLYRSHVSANIWSPIVCHLADCQASIAAVATNPRAPVFAAFQTRADNESPTRLLNMIKHLNAAYPGKYVWLTPKDWVATQKAYHSFQTGLESFDMQPSWTNAIDSGQGGGGARNVGGICCGLPEGGITMQTGIFAHTGNSTLVYSGYNRGYAHAYQYSRVFSLAASNIVVNPSTVLSYWIYPQGRGNGPESSNIVGTNSTCVALDIIFSDNSNLRDSGVMDQYGNRLHPNYQCNHLTLNTWNHVTSVIGIRVSGKIVSRINVGYDQSPDPGGYRGYIDDISLSNQAS